jgi:hypothetical protein
LVVISGKRVDRVSVDDSAAMERTAGNRNGIPPESIYAKWPMRVPSPNAKVRNYGPLSEAEQRNKRIPSEPDDS